jgi:hypothetical protein
MPKEPDSLLVLTYSELKMVLAVMESSKKWHEDFPLAMGDVVKKIQASLAVANSHMAKERGEVN